MPDSIEDRVERLERLVIDQDFCLHRATNSQFICGQPHGHQMPHRDIRDPQCAWDTTPRPQETVFGEWRVRIDPDMPPEQIRIEHPGEDLPGDAGRLRRAAEGEGR